MKGFYFITDACLSHAGNTNDVKDALKAKVEIVQYRQKQASTKEMYLEALKLRRMCKNVIFLVNDRVDIALSVGADGVHLGKDDLPYLVARKLLGKKKIIGLTVHSLKEAKEAQRLGADYISVSPIFKTGTKKDAGIPVGVTLIKKIKRQIRIPIIAIGGINLSNAEKVIQAGADGLCAISAVVTQPNVRLKIEKFQRLFRKYTISRRKED
jgi:thiamine-phosphate pyrophosphorylase